LGHAALLSGDGRHIHRRLHHHCVEEWVLMTVTAPKLHQLTVKVPMVPASCLLPNAQRRTSHHVWGPQAATLREAVGWAAGDARMQWGGPDDIVFRGPVRIYAKITWPKGRQRCDFQAAVHALKAAVDGLEDAEVLANDKQVMGMDVEQIRADRGDMAGWIELTITGEAA
jgi:Holliday junction resolvase RusA-like endonuclease